MIHHPHDHEFITSNGCGFRVLTDPAGHPVMVMGPKDELGKDGSRHAMELGEQELTWLIKRFTQVRKEHRKSNLRCTLKSK